MKKNIFKTKPTAGEIWLLIGVAVLILVLSFCFFLSIIYHLYKLNVVGDISGFVITIVLSVITTIVLIVLICYDINKEKENKFLFL